MLTGGCTDCDGRPVSGGGADMSLVASVALVTEEAESI